VADVELTFTGRLAKRATEGWVVEEGVVAEAPGAFGFVQKLTFHFAPEGPDDFTFFSQGDDTDEAGGPIPMRGQVLQHQLVIGLVGIVSGETRIGIPGGEDSRGPAQGVNSEAGIIGEEGPRGELAVEFGLEDGVGFEGVAGFFGWLDRFEVREGFDFDLQDMSGETKFTEFAGVACCASGPFDCRRTPAVRRWPGTR
jgi:hypothetical protein